MADFSPTPPNPCKEFWFISLICCCCLVAKLCSTLFDPKDYSPSGFSVSGISQARIMEWVAISFSRGFSPPRDWSCVSCIAGRFFTIEPPGKSKHKWLYSVVRFASKWGRYTWSCMDWLKWSGRSKTEWVAEANGVLSLEMGQ